MRTSLMLLIALAAGCTLDFPAIDGQEVEVADSPPNPHPASPHQRTPRSLSPDQTAQRRSATQRRAAEAPGSTAGRRVAQPSATAPTVQPTLATQVKIDRLELRLGKLSTAEKRLAALTEERSAASAAIGQWSSQIRVLEATLGRQEAQAATCDLRAAVDLRDDSQSRDQGRGRTGPLCRETS